SGVDGDREHARARAAAAAAPAAAPGAVAEQVDAGRGRVDAVAAALGYERAQRVEVGRVLLAKHLDDLLAHLAARVVGLGELGRAGSWSGRARLGGRRAVRASSAPRR